MRLLLVMLLWAAPASAKSLHWKSLTVRPRLDADGQLHVSERQAIVFDGDWNGGLRRFRIGRGQEFDLLRVTREEGTQSVDLSPGDTDAVDHYTFDWQTRLCAPARVLHLRLLVDRKSLGGYEASLVDALFFDDRNETDTLRIRGHYYRGFDPSTVINSGIKLRLAVHPDLSARSPAPSSWPVAIALIAIVAILVPCIRDYSRTENTDAPRMQGETTANIGDI